MRFPRIVALLIALWLVLIAVGGESRADAADDPTVLPGRYIVILHADVPDIEGTARSLVRGQGGTLHYVYTTALRGFAASISERAAEALRRNPNVASVEPDGIVRIEDTPVSYTHLTLPTKA